jgi:hypothetical protein
MRSMLLTGNVIRGCALLLLALGVASCGHKKSAPAPVGVGVGVSLTAPSGATIVETGGTIEIDAAVSGDAANRGVVWTLIGPGSFTSFTTTKYVYQAPSGVVGALTVTLTATAVADQTQYASVTITVNGTPKIPQPLLFPANLNIIYASYFTVAGGLAPYTWAVTSGSLPPGLVFDGSTTATTALSGIPTGLGSFTFTLQATDSNAAKASVTVTLVVNPQTACVLLGRFGYLFTGFRDQLPVVRAGSLNIASDGTITGVHDYKDDQSARVNEALTDGTCTTVSQNRGTLRIVSSRVESFDFGAVGTLAAGQMQENDGTPIVGSAQFFRQDSTAFTQAAVAGDFGFVLVGEDAANHRLVAAGRLTVGATGAISNGQGDTNGSPPIANAAITGALTAPDANGRGTTTLSLGSLSLPLAYYVVDANTIFLVSDDTSTKTLRVAGRMTRETGAGTLSATALAGQSVLSMWGSSLVGGVPSATDSVGLLSAGNGTTLKLGLDVADRGTAVVNSNYAAVPYTVTANGRGTLTLNASSGVRDFVLYMTGPGSGYLIEPGSPFGNFGIIDEQIGGPFTDFLSSYYVGGTVFATSTSPISLVPQVLFQEGSLTGNVTGSFAIDPASGRGIATVSRNILGGSGLIIYIVSTSKLVVLGDGVNTVNTSLAWLQGY